MTSTDSATYMTSWVTSKTTMAAPQLNLRLGITALTPVVLSVLFIKNWKRGEQW